MRRLPLAAATLPTLASESVGAQTAAAGLTPDSSVSFQYDTDTLAGFDIGVRAPDGSVTRYRSAGGLDSPWAGGIRLGRLAQGLVALQPATAGTALSNVGLEVQGIASGDGATKLALKMVLGRNGFNPTELAAVFVAPSGGVNASGCAVAAGDPGTAIDPPPANGVYYLFSGVGSNLTFRGSPRDTAFRTRGELASYPGLQFGASTPIYDLAGNANASIGRIDGSFAFGAAYAPSIAYTGSMPYAAARSGAVLPATGTRHYVLVSSTLVLPELGEGMGAQLAVGRVEAASLDVNFGENPFGVQDPFYGTVSFRASGSVGGVPFSVGAPGSNGAQPDRTSFYRGEGVFGTSQFSGGFAAPAGDDVVVRFTTGAGQATVTGALLFRGQ